MQMDNTNEKQKVIKEKMMYSEKNAVPKEEVRQKEEKRIMGIINGCTVTLSSNATPESSEKVLTWIRESLISSYSKKGYRIN